MNHLANVRILIFKMSNIYVIFFKILNIELTKNLSTMELRSSKNKNSKNMELSDLKFFSKTTSKLLLPPCIATLNAAVSYRVID